MFSKLLRRFTSNLQGKGSEKVSHLGRLTAQHVERQLRLSGPVQRRGLSNCGGRTPNGKPTTVYWYAASIKESKHTRR
jgi:hypothetical protein